MKIEWPDFKFGPINLYVVWPSAAMHRVNALLRTYERSMRMVYREQDIKDWAKAKGIYNDPNFMAQVKGIAEEVVETTEAYNNLVWAENLEHDPLSPWDTELEKELGDIYVFWVNACVTANVNPTDAIDAAINKITKRKGSMENGRFVKD